MIVIGEGSKVPEQVEGMGAFELEVQRAVHVAPQSQVAGA